MGKTIARHAMAPVTSNWIWTLLVGFQALFEVIGGVWSGGPSASVDHLDCQRAEHPLVTHRDIAPWLHTFKAANVIDYSQMTFDPTQKELIVGAKNDLFRLKQEDLTLIQVREFIFYLFQQKILFLL